VHVVTKFTRGNGWVRNNYVGSFYENA